MNEHQKRLWKSMISSIDDYTTNRTGFSRMVDKLQGILDAGEFQDKTLVSDWYDRWTDLETWRAADGDSVRYPDVSGAVEAMQRFLRDKLREVETG
jgi:hypothetical protein